MLAWENCETEWELPHYKHPRERTKIVYWCWEGQLSEATWALRGIRGCLTSPFGYSLSRRCFPEVTSSACEAHRTLERLTGHFSGVTRKLPGVKMTKKHHPRLDLGSRGSRARCRTVQRGPFRLLPRLRLDAVDLKCSCASLLCSRLLSQEDGAPDLRLPSSLLDP